MGSVISSEDPKKMIEKSVKSNPVVVFSKTTCPYCVKAKNLLDEKQITYVSHELNKVANGHELSKALHDRTNLGFVPQIFICGKIIGGYSELLQMSKNGTLNQTLLECSASKSNI